MFDLNTGVIMNGEFVDDYEPGEDCIGGHSLFFEGLYFRLCLFGYRQQQLKTRSGRIVDNVKKNLSFVWDEFNKTKWEVMVLAQRVFFPMDYDDVQSANGLRPRVLLIES